MPLISGWIRKVSRANSYLLGQNADKVNLPNESEIIGIYCGTPIINSWNRWLYINNEDDMRNAIIKLKELGWVDVNNRINSERAKYDSIPNNIENQVNFTQKVKENIEKKNSDNWEKWEKRFKVIGWIPLPLIGPLTILALTSTVLWNSINIYKYYSKELNSNVTLTINQPTTQPATQP